MTDEPAWDAGLAPAVRKRTRRPAQQSSDVPSPVVASVPADVVDRLDALERLVRSLRTDVEDRFQEVASRAVVLAEATDEILTRQAATLGRIEAMLTALPDAFPKPESDGALVERIERVEALLTALPDAFPKQDTSSLEAAMSALADGLISPVEAAVAATMDLKTAVASLAERIDETEPVRAEVELVAERLGTLLGGPTLTELMDRIDELAEGGRDDDAPKRRRRL